MMEFDSFGGFAKHLVGLAVFNHIVEHELIEHACVEIEKLSKQKIGEYQERQGPFAAWAELADFTKAERVRLGYTENDPGLRSGDMRDEISHKIVADVGHIGSDDDKLLWFELGTVKQPARSVLGGSAFEFEPRFREEVGISFTAMLAGGKRRILAR